MSDDACLQSAEVIQRLPHREPFLFLSRVIEVESGHEARGQWLITGAEDYLRGHFPSKPIVPGVLVVESLAQLAGLILEAPHDQHQSLGMLAHVDVRFERAVAPPATINLHARAQRCMGQLQQFEVQADIDGKSVARGTLVLAQGRTL